MNKLSKLKIRKSTNRTKTVASYSNEHYQAKLAERGLTRAQVIAAERKLAKFANAMDSVVRIPFTKQGVGADAALSTLPLAGDIAGLILTCYAFILGLQLGVPARKMLPAVKLALIDMVVGIVPIVGTLLDIFIRPSRKTLAIVHQYLHEEYGITDTMHIERPFLHQQLEDKQQRSRFWRNPMVAWLYLHIPDFIGMVVIALIGWGLWNVMGWLVNLFSNMTGFN